MKNKKALFVLLAIILILSTACNLSNQPTATPVTATEAPVESSPTAEVPSGPLSLTELYAARIQSGEWTEGEGLANLLGMYTGTAQSSSVVGNYTIEDFEVTGLLRLADQYLANNPNDSMHDEVQKQVNLLAPPLDQLERFARKRSLSAGPYHLASLSLSLPRAMADQLNCQDIWTDGFSTTPVVCFEYDEQTVEGTRLRLYYPVGWASDASHNARLRSVMQAATRAIQTFNPYGPSPLPPVTMVVTQLASVEDSTRNFETYAAAVPDHSSSLQCYVGLFPSLFALPEDEAQQTLAHELFHCYQYQNLSAQESGPLHDANEWWVEGSAEYFSNVVYPSVNQEYRWLPEVYNVMRRKVLPKWNYKAFIFFQYLENRSDVGIPGTLQLLRSMPTASGSSVAQQMEALSAYPNMDVIFHEFAQAVVDRNIIDSDHNTIPLDIPFTSGDILEATPGDTLGRGPFFFDIRRVVFPRDFDYDLTMTSSDNSGRSSARLESTPHAWGALPNPVIAGCHDINYLVVVTQTSVNTGNPFHFELHATSRPSTQLACSCLNGTWLLDNSSYLTHLNGIIEQSAPGSLTYTSVTGRDVVSFSAEGQMKQVVDHMLVNADSSVAGMSIQVSMDGISNANYTATEGQLSFTDYAADLTITTLLNNQPVAAPSNELASGPLGTGATYVCSENTLTLTPVYPNYSSLPPLTFTRQSP